MAIALSDFMKESFLDHAFNSLAGINFDSGALDIRTGAAPGPNAAVGGTLLAQITLPADAFAAAASPSIAKAGTWEDTSANAAGTAAHFRMKQSGDADGATGSTDERIEGTVGQGSGDLDLDNTTIAVGQQVTINTWTFSI